MRSRSTAVFTPLVLAGLVVIFWQGVLLRNLRRENQRLLDQARDAAAGAEETQRLALRVKELEARLEEDTRELMRLRGQSVTVRQTQQENAQLKSEQARLAQELQKRPQQAAAQSQIPAEPSPEEETPELKLRKEKLMLGRQWGLALMMFAADNKGQLPAELNTANKYMDRTNAPAGWDDLGLSKFEYVYKGQIEGVQDSARTILLREKDPVLQSSGKNARIYVFLDGHSEVVTAPAADGFPAVEKARGLIDASTVRLQ